MLHCKDYRAYNLNASSNLQQDTFQRYGLKNKLWCEIFFAKTPPMTLQHNVFLPFPE